MMINKKRWIVGAASTLCFAYAYLSPILCSDPVSVSAVLRNNAYKIYVALGFVGLIRIAVSATRKENELNWIVYSAISVLSPLWIIWVLNPVIRTIFR